MRAQKCDRCGKLYEFYDGSREFKEKRESKGYSVPGMCTQGVRRWLESEAEDKK